TTEDLDPMILHTVRTETNNRGDMNALLAACQLGRDRFLRLVERYGVDTVMSAAYDWMDYSERMLRAEIEKIPDGTYGPVVGWLDDDARNRDTRLRVETRVIVEGDEVTIDLTAANPEALPDRTTAGNSAGIHFCAYAGFDESAGEYWLYLEVNEGSYGGRHGKDAMDSVDNLMANTRNNPIEELDQRFPMRCDQYELR